MEQALKQFNWIKKYSPCFRVSGERIKILYEPKEFYETLKRLTETAKKRIVLASLYLGTGKLEQELVDCLHETCTRAHHSHSDLRVKVLLDYTRGSRGTARASSSSRTMLLSLLREFGAERVSVALYHTPDLRGILKRVLPEKYNETIGLSHLKVYLFDDTLVMSGANLSESYFTDRQDRYAYLRLCRPRRLL